MEACWELSLECPLPSAWQVSTGLATRPGEVPTVPSSSLPLCLLRAFSTDDTSPTCLALVSTSLQTEESSKAGPVHNLPVTPAVPAQALAPWSLPLPISA